MKKVLKTCVVCRRFNNLPIKLNTSSYREWRAQPPDKPYSYVFLDYLGPFTVKVQSSKTKVYLLLFTCLWSRAINIKICSDMSVAKFLLALQGHIYEEGVPTKVFSDSGSQLTAAASQISKFLDDEKVRGFLDDTGVDKLEFHHYFKGNSSMGSLVEIQVKFVKKLLYSSIRNNVLEKDEFELLVSKTVHLVNSRPIAFKESLRDCDTMVLPDPITPELLTKGRHLSCINVIPNLNSDYDDTDWNKKFDSGSISQDWISSVKSEKN